jgi:hypothetical protein
MSLREAGSDLLLPKLAKKVSYKGEPKSKWCELFDPRYLIIYLYTVPKSIVMHALCLHFFCIPQSYTFVVLLPYVLFGVDDHSMQKIAMLLVWDS